ncbi:MAG TPA: DUF1287 domain-containing protein [Pseudoxanthomonas sp.]|nr:DUF1287 domain-containing protein [Pseudoxanthomonas sp.]
MKLVRIGGMLSFALLAACRPSPPEQPQAEPTPVAPGVAVPAASPPLVAAARRQIDVTLLYDPAYVEMSYPGGDVPAERGVCTDVIVRALRSQGVDLQQTIHEDMRAHFAEYPQQWGLQGPNYSIDHRRVPNQMRWFEREGWSRPITANAADYAAGDIVAWKLSGSGLLHIGIISDRRASDGTPLVIHNIGNGTQEDDILFRHAIIGHYRPSKNP